MDRLPPTQPNVPAIGNATGAPAIGHVEQGLLKAPQVLATKNTPNTSRRGFLKAAGGLAIGVSVGGLMSPKEAKAELKPESVLDDIDRAYYIALSKLEGEGGAEGELSPDPNTGRPDIKEIENLIKKVLTRANNEKKGVHFQQHENAIWVVRYLDFLKKYSDRSDFKTKLNYYLDTLMYYPTSIGKNSPFIKDFFDKQGKLVKGVSEVDFTWNSTKRKGDKVKIYKRDFEKLELVQDTSMLAAFVDVGKAWVIVPAGTPILTYTNSNGVKVGLLAECRNPIDLYLTKCPEKIS